MNPDGGRLIDLGAPGECATWSPDSSKLMYCSHPGDGNWAVWVMSADGSDRRQLTDPICPGGRGGTPDEVGTIGALLMGPDGAFITGSDFLIDGGVTASYFYGELAPSEPTSTDS
jgi:NAD(P)-dependent dehydrogenase (short-subunit alcohol dehydrogenase family)